MVTRWLKSLFGIFGMCVPVIFILLISMLCVGVLAPEWFNQEIAFAGEPTNEPILRIETGMHTAVIGRIATDAENRFLVTGSDDKTIRVWELSTGRFIKTLRLPIGDGNEGQINAVAILPDGKTIACGGWTGWDWDGTNSIYLFDRESGNIIKRITGLPSVIRHLSYSKDGRFLVTLLGSEGIRIYRTTDYTLIAEDRDYGNDSYGVDFDRQGRLVTASDDEFIRLYDNSFKLIAKKKAPGGISPLSVSFSPDGSKIVVGYEDSSKVDVLSGKDLSYLYSPDTTDITGGDNEDLASVSWSMDGRFLYAGGQYGKDGLQPIRKWEKEGKGSYKDIPAANSTILHILPLNNGGIIYVAGGPAFGIIDTAEKNTLYKTSFIANYCNNQEGFLISNDGSTVQFGYECGGKSPARFSVFDRTLTLMGEGWSKEGLQSPITSTPDLNITDWKNNDNPKLNGKPLKLNQYEMSHSLAIFPHGQLFFLGTAWYLRFFDRDGNGGELPMTGAVWGVNISGDGKVATVALSDGTIRWYRINKWKELLALFPHKDKKRWVIWTPSGYYDSSPGADEIIGWHLNNGKDNAADFFPVSKFRGIYYRPDVIAKVIETMDENEALRLANEESGIQKQEIAIQKMLPPVVTIISPQDSSEVSTPEIKVRFNIRTPSGEPVTGVKALIDGRPVQQGEGSADKREGRDTETSSG